MSLFGNILEKLGMKRPSAPAAPTKPAATAASPAPQGPPAAGPSGQFSHFNRPEPQSPPPAPSAPRPAPQVPPAAPVASAAPRQEIKPTPQITGTGGPQLAAAPQPGPAAPAAPTAPASIPMVDVVTKLEHLAAENPQRLNWKVSIVDLLKLLDLDSSFEARKELAIELGCPADKMGDSAQMNVWLHKTVLQKIAENGGNIPKELLD